MLGGPARVGRQRHDLLEQGDEVDVPPRAGGNEAEGVRQLAHDVARVVAETRARAEDALALLQPEGVLPQASLQTVFKRPLLLPAQATLWQAAASLGEQLFEVRDASGQVPHLRARLTRNPSTAQP